MSPTVLIPDMGNKFKSWNQNQKRAHLLQEDLPGVEPFQVDGCHKGVKEPCDQDGEGKQNAEVAQQLVCFVLLCKRPNVEDKGRMSFSHTGG